MIARNFRFKFVVALVSLPLISIWALPQIVSRAYACVDCSGTAQSYSCQYMNVDPCGVYNGGACVTNFQPDSCSPTKYAFAKLTDLGNTFYFCMTDGNPGDTCAPIALACADWQAYSKAGCPDGYQIQGKSGTLVACSAQGTICSGSPPPPAP